MTTDMKGKVCVVTGGNSGIGLVTARELARMGAEVSIVCRSRERGEAAVAKIKAATGFEPELFVADLGLMAEVRRVADEIAARHPKIDVLVNNAGVLKRHREENAEGREITWAINHLGPFLLTNLLLDAIKAAAPARIVNVASLAHRRAHINFDDLEATQSFSMWPVYGQSKLANILFTRELAKRLEGTGVTANALHPGVIATQLFIRLPMMGLLHPLARLLFLTPEQGARTSIYLATSPEVDGVTGKYFAKSTPAPTSAAARDMDVAARLWQVSEQMTGLAK